MWKRHIFTFINVEYNANIEPFWPGFTDEIKPCYFCCRICQQEKQFKMIVKYLMEGMMLKLKLEYFGHLMRRVDSLEKTLMREELGAGGEGDDRGWDGWMASLTQWTWVWVNSRSWWWTGSPGVLRFMGSQRVRHNWVTELNWHPLKSHSFLAFFIRKPNRRLEERKNLQIYLTW